MLDKYFPLYILIFFMTFIGTVVIEKRLIPCLKKHAKQPIYEDGPKWHMQKSGTPTMGGIAFLIAVSFSLLICSLFASFALSADALISIALTLCYAISNAAIGIWDDKKKLKKKHNSGLTPGQKMFFQFISAFLFVFGRAIILDDSTAISFSFGTVDLGIFYYPLAIFILLGVVNCANLTDGIDGLATSIAFSIGVSLLYISAALNVECAFVASSIIGATVGFLIFNIHPAKIFMGDTGSLFFGALIASCAFTLKNPLMILFIAGVYILEGVSVVIQVIYYKITRKRIFKMAPLHHHLEKCGWSENRICILAIICTFIMSIPAYMFYLP